MIIITTWCLKLQIIIMIIIVDRYGSFQLWIEPVRLWGQLNIETVIPRYLLSALEMSSISI